MSDQHQHYTSVTDMLRGLGIDAELVKSTEEAINSRKIISDLMARRAAKGLTQGQIAAALDCTQSRVSKLESSSDDDIRLGDLRKYAAALQCELVACALPKALTAADKVKINARAIHKHLDDMLKLANDDKEIAAGVSQFLVEAFVNLTGIVGQAMRRLPKKDDGTPYCEVKLDVKYMEPFNDESTEDDADHTDCVCDECAA